MFILCDVNLFKLALTSCIRNYCVNATLIYCVYQYLLFFMIDYINYLVKIIIFLRSMVKLRFLLIVQKYFFALPEKLRNITMIFLF